MDIKECPNVSAPSLSSSTRWWSKDMVAVVTRANKGIGFLMVKKLAELGLTVILTARDTERGRKVVDELRRQHDLHWLFSRPDVGEDDLAFDVGRESVVVKVIIGVGVRV
ncbi:hypothetical protein K2173_025659 [Erythroxylum novogranatense]|uniref:Uncharacterized protein n=1 Tax=Erythroxylum novogranatense TaxID=1862640 RepID=A0AAV8SBN5_9ROSI|nr:hypothetical protein K2173_025659 [Erythroxylum novogranatense]